jgi:FK506-binding protein 1
MGVTKKLITPGNGVDKPQKGDTITMEYTGNLHDPNAPDGKGQQYVFSTLALTPQRLQEG